MSKLANNLGPLLLVDPAANQPVCWMVQHRVRGQALFTLLAVSLLSSCSGDDEMCSVETCDGNANIEEVDDLESAMAVLGLSTGEL